MKIQQQQQQQFYLSSKQQQQQSQRLGKLSRLITNWQRSRRKETTTDLWCEKIISQSKRIRERPAAQCRQRLQHHHKALVVLIAGRVIICSSCCSPFLFWSIIYGRPFQLHDEQPFMILKSYTSSSFIYDDDFLSLRVNSQRYADWLKSLVCDDRSWKNEREIEKKRVLFCNSLLSFLGEEIKSFNHKHGVCVL